jgi:Ca-activated chloride channel family protein
MSFRDLRWLWLLAAVPVAAIFLLSREKLRERIARRFVTERLRGVGNPARPLRPWLIVIGLGLAVFALAGPSRGFVSVPIQDREANRVVAIDVSNSMLAQDVGTSRLAAGKAIARRIIDAFPGRVALVDFESSAEVVSPLTNDSDAVSALLESIEAGEIGDPGTDFGNAIIQSMRLVESDPGAKADIVIISDGEDQGSKLAEALRNAKQRGVTVSTILIGSGEGAAIPMPDGSSLRDDSGRVVTTYARRDALQQIASATGGTFLENPFAEHALDPLLTVRGGGATKQRTVRIPVDRYQWPLALAFVALFLGSIAHRGAE